MKVGDYYRSHEPTFAWVFWIQEILPSGRFIALSSGGVPYLFEPGREAAWTPATIDDFLCG